MKYKYERNTQILMRVYFSIEQINDPRRGGRVQRDRSFSPFSFFLFARETKNRGISLLQNSNACTYFFDRSKKRWPATESSMSALISDEGGESFFFPPLFSFYTKYKNETNRDVFLYIFFYRAN